jgi:hypothetical protein
MILGTFLILMAALMFVAAFVCILAWFVEEDGSFGVVSAFLFMSGMFLAYLADWRIASVANTVVEAIK